MANAPSQAPEHLGATPAFALRLLARQAWARPRVSRGMSSPGAFAEALLARLSTVNGPAGPAGTLLLQPSPPPSAPGAAIVNRHAHWQVTVAPRLSLTLITLASPAPAPAQRASTAGAQGPERSPEWGLTRPAASAGAESRTAQNPVRIALPAITAAASHSSLAHARATAIPAVQQRPSTPDRGSALAPPALAVRLYPPARPARMVHRAPASAAAPGPVATSHAPSAQGESPAWPALRGRPQPAPLPLVADPAAISRIADTVMLQLDHRIQAYRERTGRA